MALASQRSIQRNILRNQLKKSGRKTYNGRHITQEARQQLRDQGIEAAKKKSVFGALYASLSKNKAEKQQHTRQKKGAWRHVT